MAYYIRVLIKGSECPNVMDLRGALDSAGYKASVFVDQGGETDWSNLVLENAASEAISAIERSQVSPGSLGAEELDEFAEEVAECRPVSAAKWLLEYFRQVKTVYAFQVLSGARKENGWSILHEIQTEIWNAAPGLLQADLEGFTNEDGFHILWQFAEDVKGPWNMAVLEKDSEWASFQMELSDRSQREAFLSGRVPKDARPVGQIYE